MDAFYELYHDEQALVLLDHGLPPRGDSDLIKRLRRLTRKAQPRRVVDVGCGTGTHTFELAAAFPKAMVAGVDPYRPGLEEARAEVKPGDCERVFFLEGILSCLPFEDGETDLLWCFDTFCHCPDPEESLRECARVLKPGGLMMLCTATLANEASSDSRLRTTLEHIGVHPGSMDSTIITAALHKTGFTIVEHDNYHSEFLESIDRGEPGRVSGDVLRLSRLLRDRPHWIKQCGEERVRLIEAFLRFNVAILTGQLNYQAWFLKSPRKQRIAGPGNQT